MKKLVTCCVAVGSVVAVGIVVRQILFDLRIMPTCGRPLRTPWRTEILPRGYGAIGSAPALQAGGYGFESR